MITPTEPNHDTLLLALPSPIVTLLQRRGERNGRSVSQEIAAMLRMQLVREEQARRRVMHLRAVS